MSEEYMTGQQLHDEVHNVEFFKLFKTEPWKYSQLDVTCRNLWDAFAARVKMPRPKPPQTMCDVYYAWSCHNLFPSHTQLEDLLSRLTAAKAALDEWNATHGKDAT